MSYKSSLQSQDSTIGRSCVCKENTSTIFVYWDWAARNPAQFAPLDETIPPSKNGYYRILRVVGEKFVRGHCDASASERSDRQTCPVSDRYVSVSAFCDASRSFSWLVSFLLYWERPWLSSSAAASSWPIFLRPSPELSLPPCAQPEEIAGPPQHRGAR